MASRMSPKAITRRNLLKSSGLLALSSAIPSSAINSSAANPPDPNIDTNIYESIGVRPITNCRGTFTIISPVRVVTPVFAKARVRMADHTSRACAPAITIPKRTM